MAKLNWRRGATVGAIVSLLMAATSSGWSEDQPRASVETLAFGLLFTLVAVAVVRAIQTNASSQRR
jgi:hypothetical protein